jgi:succinyl-CoA synthetase beta subunit
VARLYEYQGKTLLKRHDIPIPNGLVVSTPQDAASVASRLGTSVAVKAQTWSTDRAKAGGVRFASEPEQAQVATAQILGRELGGVPVTQVLVEARVPVRQEFFVSFGVDDATRAPFVLFSHHGGTGIEGRATDVHRLSIRLSHGLRPYHARDLVRQAGITGRLQLHLGEILAQLWTVCRQYEARSLEINPLALAEDGQLYVLDCRIAIDDYAIFRHPELDIEVARELDRPPTALDKIAYQVEADDFRGTFYFFEMETSSAGGPRIGFHGGGGGGSMLAMDALLTESFRLANFSDLSGNPPASKIYRAARIILSQPNLAGYFHSGSGVASQELTETARALAKAFREAPLAVPAVIRLGGNAETEAIRLLEVDTQDLPAPVIAFGRDTDLATCVRRLRQLVATRQVGSQPNTAPTPTATTSTADYVFSIRTGEIAVDHAACAHCQSKACIAACPPQILELDGDAVVLAIPQDEAVRGGCIECAACEVACRLRGESGLHIRWPIPGLEAA